MTVVLRQMLTAVHFGSSGLSMLLQTTCPSWVLVMSFPSLFSLGFEKCLIAPLGPILLTVLHHITMSRFLPPGTIPSSSNNTQNGLMLFLATGPGDPLNNVKQLDTCSIPTCWASSSSSPNLPGPRNNNLAPSGIGTLVAFSCSPPPILYLPYPWPSFRCPMFPA